MHLFHVGMVKKTIGYVMVVLTTLLHRRGNYLFSGKNLESNDNFLMRYSPRSELVEANRR
jgi:hypothetical protein